MSDLADIEGALRRYMIDELGLLPSLTNDDLLTEKGFLASAQLIDVVTFIEDSFGVVLKPVDVSPQNLATISAIATSVRRRAEAG